MLEPWLEPPGLAAAPGVAGHPVLPKRRSGHGLIEARPIHDSCTAAVSLAA